MLEIVMIIAAVVLTARIAGMEGKSGFVAGGITLALCIGSLFVVPLPLIRIGLVTVAVLVGWTIWNMFQKK